MDGLIYYNVGMKCLVRLVVSLSTLTRHCKAPITILASVDSYEQCKQIADHFKVDILLADFDSDREKNWVLLNKCRLHQKTPYDRTLFIDSDTIVLRDISSAFDYLDDAEFIVTQFSNWRTDGRHYKKRIERWNGLIDKELLNTTYKETRAVNTGFYGWCRGAKIFDAWYDTAKINRLGFIPDEIACQILLPNYDYKIISSEYNTSCKYENITDKTKTVHYHGRKHCRIEDGKYLYHSDLWYSEFNKIKHLPFVLSNIEHDRMLMKHIRNSLDE